MFPTKILLATDGSEEAGRATRMATVLSEKVDSELHLVRVEPIPSALADSESVYYGAGYSKQMREIARQDASEKLDEEVQKIRGLGGEVAGPHVRVGQPDAEIVRLAEEIEAGLVVVGSRGFAPLRRALLGSVSDSVVRHAHCPVLVVRSEDRRRTADTRPTEELGEARA
jgi:nucleotide-binding universal stress UspA family protein